MFSRKPDTPTDHACKILQNYFEGQKIPIKISVGDREEPDVSIKIEPDGWQAAFAHTANLGLSDTMAQNTQQVGFILGQMSTFPTKLHSIVIEYNIIKAPDGVMLEQFLERWVAEQSQLKGKS